MKKVIIKSLLLCSFLFLFLFHSIAQFVTLSGKQFKDENGNNFYPKVLNYYVDLAYDSNYNLPPNDFSHTYLAQFIQTGSDGCYNYPNITDGDTRILQDFYEIKNLGFNVIRLVFQVGKKDRMPGFYYTIQNFSKCAYLGSFIDIDIYPPYDPSTNYPLNFYFNKLKEIIDLA
jgi:hypothetical protein